MFADRLRRYLLERLPYQLRPKQYQMKRMELVPAYDFRYRSSAMVSLSLNEVTVTAIESYTYTVRYEIENE